MAAGASALAEALGDAASCDRERDQGGGSSGGLWIIHNLRLCPFHALFSKSFQGGFDLRSPPCDRGRLEVERLSLEA